MRNRIYILSFFFIFLKGVLYAQTQDSTLRSIVSKLSDFTSSVPREEIFIHTDKEEYIAGEDFWFNAFLFDRKSLHASDESKIVYIEILNTDNKPVVQKRILLKNCTGPGHFILPDTLKTGIYSVRAYTNQMKNFLPYNCFIKDITVYNTLKKGSTRVIRNVSKTLASEDVTFFSGATLKIKSDRTDSLVFDIETSHEFRNRNGEYGYMIIQTRGKTDFAQKIHILDSLTRISVSKDKLPGGINQVVIFNRSGEYLTHRFIFTPVRKSDSLTATAGETYPVRSRITVGVDMQGMPGKNSRLSISVSPVTGDIPPDIEDYLVFGSEFNSEHGFIQEDILKNQPERGRDSILSGLKSNWINWTEILSGNLPVLKYSPETDYQFIYGSVPGGQSDTVLMCSPSAKPSFAYTKTDADGNFTFSLHIDEEPKDLIFIPQKNNPDMRPLIYSSFSDRYFSFGEKDSVAIEPVHFSRAGIDYQVRRLFNTSVTGNAYPPAYPSQRPARIYGAPDLEIKLSDYIELPTMNEIFAELIPGVSLRSSKDGYEIKMSDRINDRRIDFDPALMIDGVIIKDAALIAGLDPSLVDRIEVTSQRYLIGDYLLDGIVNVMTKAADFNLQLPAYMTRTSYRIADPVVSYNSPVSSGSPGSRIPDYRNTLFWDPQIPGSASIEFRSSDNKMKYLISIQGITADGKPVSVRKTFSVE